MQDKRNRPFKSGLDEKSNIPILNISVTSMALIIIAITQIPISIKATLDIFCMPINEESNSEKIFLCQ